VNVAMQNFWLGAFLGFLLGAVVTTITAIKFNEWQTKREKQKWYVRRGVWTR